MCSEMLHDRVNGKSHFASVVKIGLRTTFTRLPPPPPPPPRHALRSWGTFACSPLPVLNLLSIEN